MLCGSDIGMICTVHWGFSIFLPLLFVEEQVVYALLWVLGPFMRRSSETRYFWLWHHAAIFLLLFLNPASGRSVAPFLEMIKGGTLLPSGGVILLIWYQSTSCRQKKEKFNLGYFHMQYQDNLFPIHWPRFWDGGKEASWAAAKIREWTLLNKHSVALYNTKHGDGQQQCK